MFFLAWAPVADSAPFLLAVAEPAAEAGDADTGLSGMTGLGVLLESRAPGGGIAGGARPGGACKGVAIRVG